jgi:hypothetical protein
MSHPQLMAQTDNVFEIVTIINYCLQQLPYFGSCTNVFPNS